MRSAKRRSMARASQPRLTMSSRTFNSAPIFSGASRRRTRTGLRKMESIIPKPPSGKRINFGERGEILGKPRAKIFEKSDELRKRARIRGDEHVLAAVAARIVRRDRVPASVEPEELRVRLRSSAIGRLSTIRIESPSGNRFASVTLSTHGSFARRSAIGARSSITRLRERHGSTAFRRSSVRERSFPAISNRWSAKSEPVRKRAAPPAAATATSARRRTAPSEGLLARCGPAAAEKQGLAIHAGGTPRRISRCRPRPSSTAGRPSGGSSREFRRFRRGLARK